MIRTPSSIIVPPVKSLAPEMVREPVPVLWKVPGPDSMALMVPASTTSWDARSVPPTKLPPVKNTVLAIVLPLRSSVAPCR